MEKKRIIIVGGGVAGICSATKFVDNGYPGELITVIDMGKDPFKRQPEEVMSGFMGCGLWSDGKLTYHHMIGGQLSKYCGEDKAYSLMDEVIEMVKRFHPNPEAIMYSNPTEVPDFIKPHFDLRLFGVYHIGTDYLHEIGKNWYNYLVEKGVKFYWEQKVKDISFEENKVTVEFLGEGEEELIQYETFDTLIFAVGKSGIDFTQNLINKYNLPTEVKSVQIGVRFEAPQKYFQKLIDVSYDFKLYQKPSDDVSIRSFCVNNNAAYVAMEKTYGDMSYNGHAKKGKEFENNMTNFGILMEIKGIEDPFEWARKAVQKCQAIRSTFPKDSWLRLDEKVGYYFSPSRTPSKTSEGIEIKCLQISGGIHALENIFGEYSKYLIDFINQLNEIFRFGEDWGIYIPEVKYLAQEPIVDYKNLSLIDYPNIHFVGDALSSRGISVSGSQGILVAESILNS